MLGESTDLVESPSLYLSLPAQYATLLSKSLSVGHAGYVDYQPPQYCECISRRLHEGMDFVINACTLSSSSCTSSNVTSLQESRGMLHGRRELPVDPSQFPFLPVRSRMQWSQKEHRHDIFLVSAQLRGAVQFAKRGSGLSQKQKREQKYTQSHPLPEPSFR